MPHHTADLSRWILDKYRAIGAWLRKKNGAAIAIAIIVALIVLFRIDWNPLPKAPSRDQIAKEINRLGTEKNLAALDSLYETYVVVFKRDMKIPQGTLYETLLATIQDLKGDAVYHLLISMVMDLMHEKNNEIKGKVVDRLIALSDDRWARLRDPVPSSEASYYSSPIAEELHLLKVQDPAIPAIRFLAHKDSAVRVFAGRLMYAQGQYKWAGKVNDTITRYHWHLEDTFTRYEIKSSNRILTGLLQTPDPAAFAPVFYGYLSASGAYRFESDTLLQQSVEAGIHRLGASVIDSLTKRAKRPYGRHNETVGAIRILCVLAGTSPAAVPILRSILSDRHFDVYTRSMVYGALSKMTDRTNVKGIEKDFRTLKRDFRKKRQRL